MLSNLVNYPLFACHILKIELNPCKFFCFFCNWSPVCVLIYTWQFFKGGWYICSVYNRIAEKKLVCLLVYWSTFPRSYSFVERDSIWTCYISSKPLLASSVLISKLANISLQTASCSFSSYTASYVGLYICYGGYYNAVYNS